MLARKRRIAVYEREESIRTVLARYFAAFGDHVEETANFDDVIRRISDTEFDLLLLGMDFGAGDRLNWLARIASIDPMLPTIVLSEECGAGAVVSAMRLGARDFLMKPLSFDELDRSVRNVFARDRRRMHRSVISRVNRRFVVEMPSTTECVGGVVHEVLHLCEGFIRKDSDREVKIPLLVAEALYNAIEHGNHRNTEKKIRVEATADEREFCIQITDEGAGFDPESIPNPLAMDASEEIHGRGIFMMKVYADVLKWSDGGRTIIVKKQW